MGGPFSRGRPLSFPIGLRVACLEKLIGELLLAPARQPVVAQQPRLELREVRVYDVGRVGDAAAHVIIPCEQVRKIAPNAQVGAAQRLVRVVGLARTCHLRPLVEILAPPAVPFLESAHEGLLVRLGERVRQPLELTGSLRLRLGGQILPHRLLLVELANLDGYAAERLQQSAPAVAHDADNLVSHRQEGAHPLDVHGHGLRLHEVPQQILARQCVLEQHHSEVAPPVGRVHDHHDPPRSVYSRHRPVPVNLPLDGLGRTAVLLRQLGVGLPQRHVFLPKLLVAHTVSTEELALAPPTLVYLNPILVPVSLHFRASAKNAFFLFIAFDLCLTPANIGVSKDFSLIFVHYIEK